MKKLVTLLTVLALLLSFYACGPQGNPALAPVDEASEALTTPDTGGEATAADTGGEVTAADTGGEVTAQEGTPKAVIFDRDGYRLILERYAYTQNQALEMEFSFETPAGVNADAPHYCITIRSINGWTFGGSWAYPDMNLTDYVSSSDSTAVISLNRPEDVAMPLALISQLQQIEFEITGWANDNYDRIGDGYDNATFTLDLSMDAQSGYVQPLPDNAVPLFESETNRFASLGFNEEKQELTLLHTFTTVPNTYVSEDKPADYRTVIAPVVNGIQGMSVACYNGKFGTMELLHFPVSTVMDALKLPAVESLAVNINGVLYPILGEPAAPDASIDALPVLYQDGSVRVSFVQWRGEFNGPNPIFLVQPLSEHAILQFHNTALETVESGETRTYGAMVTSEDINLAQPYVLLFEADQFHSYDYGNPDPLIMESATLTLDLVNDLSETVTVRCSLDEFIPELLPQGEGLAAGAETPIFESEYATIHYLGSEPTVIEGTPTTNLRFDVQVPSGPIGIFFHCKGAMTASGGGLGRDYFERKEAVIPTTYTGVIDGIERPVDVTGGRDTILVQIEIYKYDDGNWEILEESDWILLKLR